MGIATRRGSAAALLAAGAMVFTPLAATAADDSNPIDIDGNVDVSDEAETPDIWRFANYDRITTAIEAMERTNNLWGDTVIIATAGDFADALAAAPLADELNAPILLDNPYTAAVDPRVSAAIQAEGFDNVIIVGGTDVFGESYYNSVDAIPGLFDIGRFAGVNRYQTAVSLAQAAIDVDWTNNRELQNANIFLADGTDYADAVSAGAAAANHSGVVLLTRGSAGLDSATYNAITGENGGFQGWWVPNHSAIISVGGPATTAAAIGHLNDPIEVDDSVVGANRYETAVMVAEEYVPGAVNYAIASGRGYADAVVAGAYAANVDGPLLLTQNDNLPQVVEDYFNDFERAAAAENVFLFGGLDSVSRGVSVELTNLRWNRY